MRKLSVGFIVLIVGVVSLAQERSRIMPPPQLKCDRNDLTSYDGRILAYRRPRRKHLSAYSHEFRYD